MEEKKVQKCERSAGGKKVQICGRKEVNGKREVHASRRKCRCKMKYIYRRNEKYKSIKISDVEESKCRRKRIRGNKGCREIRKKVQQGKEINEGEKVAASKLG